MMTIYQHIANVQQAFRELPEFKALEEAVEAVRQDEEAKMLFTNFRDVQMKFQQKQVAGEELTEDEYVYLQKTAQLAQQNMKILEMLEAEMALSTTLEEVTRQITEPIQGLYDGL